MSWLLKLDPMNDGLKTGYGMNLYYAGKYNEAIKGIPGGTKS